jgi:hypothetical protein
MRKSLQTFTPSPGSVFLLALLLRLIVSYLFLGSIDTINAIGATSDYLAKNGSLPLPYFSVVPQSLVLSSLTALIDLPANMIVKLPGNIADAGLAWLLFRHGRRQDKKKFEIAGILYAVNPLAILITSSHGQFDPIWLFFILYAFVISQSTIEMKVNNYAVGVALGLAIVTKPSSVLCVILFLPWCIKFLGRFVAVTLGFVSMVTASMILLISIGIDPYSQFKHSLTYSLSGFGVFGLTKTPLQVPRYLYFVLLLSAIAYLLLMTYLNKFDIPKAAALLIMFYLAIGPIAPQYLIWPIVMIFASSIKNRIAVNLSMILFFILVFYYKDPTASYLPFENTLSFAVPTSFPIPGVSLEHSIEVNKSKFLSLILNYAIPLLFARKFAVLRFESRANVIPADTSGVVSFNESVSAAFFLTVIFLATSASLLFNFVFVEMVQPYFVNSIYLTTQIYAIDFSFGPQLAWPLGWVGVENKSFVNAVNMILFFSSIYWIAFLILSRNAYFSRGITQLSK